MAKVSSKQRIDGGKAPAPSSIKLSLDSFSFEKKLLDDAAMRSIYQAEVSAFLAFLGAMEMPRAASHRAINGWIGDFEAAVGKAVELLGKLATEKPHMVNLLVGLGKQQAGHNPWNLRTAKIAFAAARRLAWDLKSANHPSALPSYYAIALAEAGTGFMRDAKDNLETAAGILRAEAQEVQRKWDAQGRVAYLGGYKPEWTAEQGTLNAWKNSILEVAKRHGIKDAVLRGTLGEPGKDLI